jgi:hypothetical protein
MKEGTIVARDLVERLWKDFPDAQPQRTELVLPTLPPSDYIVHRQELAYLNRSWIWASEADAASRRESPFRLRRWLKARLARLIMRSLGHYFLEERAFIERLVRFQNDLARKVDQLSDEIRQIAFAERSAVDWMRNQVDELSRRNHLLHGLLEARVERLEASLSGERKSPP